MEREKSLELLTYCLEAIALPAELLPPGRHKHVTRPTPLLVASIPVSPLAYIAIAMEPARTRSASAYVSRSANPGGMMPASPAYDGTRYQGGAMKNFLFVFAAAAFFPASLMA